MLQLQTYSPFKGWSTLVECDMSQLPAMNSIFAATIEDWEYVAPGEYRVRLLIV
jgi:hypothetical protein